jgi:hypothetical protein
MVQAEKINIFLFSYAVAGTLERKPFESSWEEFRSKFWTVYMVIRFMNAMHFIINILRTCVSLVAGVTSALIEWKLFLN